MIDKNVFFACLWGFSKLISRRTQTSNCFAVTFYSLDKLPCCKQQAEAVCINVVKNPNCYEKTFIKNIKKGKLENQPCWSATVWRFSAQGHHIGNIWRRWLKKYHQVNNIRQKKYKECSQLKEKDLVLLIDHRENGFSLSWKSKMVPC